MSKHEFLYHRPHTNKRLFTITCLTSLVFSYILGELKIYCKVLPSFNINDFVDYLYGFILSVLLGVNFFDKDVFLYFMPLGTYCF